eukprot:1155972-Pelagomonas_calceolata.AAC.5
MCLCVPSFRSAFEAQWMRAWKHAAHRKKRSGTALPMDLNVWAASPTASYAHNARASASACLGSHRRRSHACDHTKVAHKAAPSSHALTDAPHPCLLSRGPLAPVFTKAMGHTHKGCTLTPVLTKATGHAHRGCTLMPALSRTTHACTFKGHAHKGHAHKGCTRMPALSRRTCACTFKSHAHKGPGPRLHRGRTLMDSLCLRSQRRSS